MDTAEPDTSEPTTPGARLRAYIDARWSRKEGGIRGLSSQIGTTAETMYEWFRDEREPSLGYLRELADKLGVTRSQIVAAMDGEAPVLGLDPLTREAVREEVRATLRDLGRL